MASASLDQLVKGSPATGNPLPSSSTNSDLSNSTQQSYHQEYTDPSSPPHPSTPDPLSTLPSSPPQIYLNLLILESSLRAQYLALRERRRQNTFFLLLLAAWIAYFAYALFLRPREDGRGVGGSVYWVVEMGEKVALLGGVVTALLVWGTGQWERGVRWPRRWLAVANRGLRTMNTKIVVIRGPWWQELLSYLSFLFPFSLPIFPSPTGDFQYIERPASEKRGGRPLHPYYNVDTESGLVEEDLSPGGDYIRLLLLPKSFSPEFRGNWDDYRVDFWEKENDRRAQLRQKLRQKERQLAQQDGGWFWWFGFGWKASQRRRFAAATIAKSAEDRGHHRPHHQSSISKHSHDLKTPLRRSTRSESHSRTPSRSTTPVDTDDRPPSRSSATSRPRRGSLTPNSTASGSEQSQQHRRKKSKTITRGISPLTQAQVREGVRAPSFSSDDSGVFEEKDIPKDDPDAS
ncbi:Spo7-like protein-domain-containing protein [Aspergillus avenaceus]|uniref:Spo7-like protein-domain-containing protein n=1 Tax=Aspergillus avenaceus TaxID=36643 RepID=A0A5N6TFN2_ASPAV|nr:Spo7-like protein-domain-containing protein [Aspergillus avenaceus]